MDERLFEAVRQSDAASSGGGMLDEVGGNSMCSRVVSAL
jgi:hypothetical protein